MPTQPNILLILTDQQRFDTIEALGNRFIKTPTLNRLVEEGTAFTRAYTPSPVCVPARYALLTGQMPYQTGCCDNGPMPRGRRSIMEVLAEQGYQTHGVGKMHFTFPDAGRLARWGFAERDVSEEGGAQPGDDFYQHLAAEGWGHVYDAHGVRSDMYYIPQPSQLPARLHHSTWVADRSIAYLQQRDRKTPFFLMTSFIKPHPPFESPTPWNKLYRGPAMPLPKVPDGWEHLLTYWNHYQNRYKYRDQGCDHNLLRTMKAAYYSAISFVDYNLGRLLAYMEQNGLLDNTLILYTSDHGELLGDYHCFGKRCFLDAAARVPLIMRSPDAAGGSCCSRPVSLVDIVPTILESAGIAAQEHYAGDSLLAIQAGQTPRETVFGQFQSEAFGQYMAVSEQYKYIYSAPDQKEWLFDLAVDPEETRNRAYNPLYRDATAAMRRRLITVLEQESEQPAVDRGDWKHFPSPALPSDPDAGLLFQDPPDSLPDIPGYTSPRA